MKIKTLFNNFRKSDAWATFSDQTRRQYNYLTEGALLTLVGGDSFGNMEVKTFLSTTDYAEDLYTRVSVKGVTVANQTRVAINAMLRWAGYESPFHKAALIAAGKEVCSTQDIVQLLNTGYGQFKYRNVSLILHLVYLTGQPAHKITHLTWDDVDLLGMSMTVDGVRVEMDADVHKMLTDQEEDFGFQPYVAPSPYPTKQGYVPYGQTQFSRTLNKLKREAGFPPSHRLNIAEIRRAGLIARVENGADADELRAIDSTLNTRAILRIKRDAGVDNISI